ncbi:hypothetical protein CK633_04965 [Brucella melitensis]|nr:hypothetical protein CK633_04965 [Brucella melitensis]
MEEQRRFVEVRARRRGGRFLGHLASLSNSFALNSGKIERVKGVLAVRRAGYCVFSLKFQIAVGSFSIMSFSKMADRECNLSHEIW